MKIYKRTKKGTEVNIYIFGINVYRRTNEKKSFALGLFKVKRKNNKKRYYLFKICVYRKPYLQSVNGGLKIYKYDYNNVFIVENYINSIKDKIERNAEYVKNLILNSKTVMIGASSGYLNHSHGWMKYLFNGALYSFNSLPYDNKGADLFVTLGGIGPSPSTAQVIVESLTVNKPVLFLEAAFLRSVVTFCDEKASPKFRYDIGFVLDPLGAYYDGTRPNMLENMLNDKNLVITEEQKARARKCIDFIVSNKLSKYNSQPIFVPSVGRAGADKVLVVDQSFGDSSVKKGCASVSTFEEMLNAAINENPNADIIIKTHPDTMTGNRSAYYSHIKTHDNIYVYSDPINPISLIEYVSKVYVCTTQLGFEALMCGKETHVFGMPFYAGWGLSRDMQVCPRRTNRRSLEEVFYITYILYSYYINPFKECHCEIEEAADILLSLRDEYFSLKSSK